MKYKDLRDYLKKNFKLKDLEEISDNSIENHKEETFNIFQNINMREDSHTKLLAWLLDNKNKDNNCIQHFFLCNFIEFLTDWEYIEKIDNIEEYVNDLSLQVKTQYKYKLENCNSNYIDLLMYSLEKKFVCIIENKLDAKICSDDSGVTQLEKYKNYIEEDFIKNKFNLIDTTEIKKIYLFLSSFDLTKKKVKTVCKKGSDGKVILSYNNEDVSNRQFKYLLNCLKYKTIEHSDIVLMIYQSLRQIGYDFKNAKITKDDIKEIFSSIVDSYNGNEQNKGILKSIGYKEESKGKLNNFNFDIDKILNNFISSKKQDLVLKILNQYITYWEYYNEFVSGYSEIVETQINGKIYGIYSWDIENLKKDIK